MGAFRTTVLGLRLRSLPRPPSPRRRPLPVPPATCSSRTVCSNGPLRISRWRRPWTLAGYGGHSRGFSRTTLADVDETDQWIDVVAEAVELWGPRSEKIAQVGLLGDEFGRLKFVTWASADLPEPEEGEAHRFESVVTDEYQGRSSASCNSATAISPSDDVVAASDGGVAVVGSVVDVQDGSGLIKRCPEADCTRVLSGERCAEHGAVEGEFDLRIKAIVHAGNRSINAIFDAEATATVSGLSLEDAQAMAMDALDTGVVVEASAER